MIPLLKATLQLYGGAAKEALKAIGHHPFKPLFGFLFILVISLVEKTSGLCPGFAGGMLLGLAMTFILAGFLSLVNLIFNAKKFKLQETVNFKTGILGQLITAVLIIFLVRFLFHTGVFDLHVYLCFFCQFRL